MMMIFMEIMLSKSHLLGYEVEVHNAFIKEKNFFNVYIFFFNEY